MPQLDIYNIFSQIFWGSFFFLSFYFFVVLIVVPTIFSILFSRVFLSTYNKEYYEVSFAIIFFSENSFFENHFEPTAKALEHALNSTIDSHVVCESTLNNKTIFFIDLLPKNDF